jgi:hypothetical protein
MGLCGKTVAVNIHENFLKQGKYPLKGSVRPRKTYPQIEKLIEKMCEQDRLKVKKKEMRCEMKLVFM